MRLTTVALRVLLSFSGGTALCIGGTGSAQTPEIVQAARSERGWALVTEGAATWVVDRRGAVQTLPLVEGESLFVPAGLGGRWLAGGTRVDPNGMDLLLVGGDVETFERLPVPPRSNGGGSAALRLRAVPLVSDDRLVGLAWLEGDGHRSLAVRTAAWVDERWSVAETVSPVGPGSQSGLVGTVLADGSWLLVWAAFDGEDDELLWSRKGADGWSPATAVHASNEVQDVRPAVVAAGDGALVAWSRFDGSTYRTHLARLARGLTRSGGLDGTGWQETVLASPPATVQPSLVANDRGVVLVMKTVAPLGWAIFELLIDGTTVRRSTVAEPLPPRPLIDASGKSFSAWWWLRGGHRGTVELVEDDRVDEAVEYREERER